MRKSTIWVTVILKWDRWTETRRDWANYDTGRMAKKLIYKKNFVAQHSNSASPCCVTNIDVSWWRNQMGPFYALLALCVGNSPYTGEIAAQRPVTRSFDVLFDLRNKRLSKQSWGWGFQTPSRPLWRHCNVLVIQDDSYSAYMILHGLVFVHKNVG